jgi:lysine-N-methylase
VPTSETAPAQALIAHALYGCRHRGVCCSSNWEIAVEAPLYARLASAIADGALRPVVPGAAALVERPGLPAGLRAVLGRSGGRCVFHAPEAPGCRLHAWGGPQAKPAACQQFPWLAVHDPRGTFVSLSHVCPTAAELLRVAAPLTIAPLAAPAAAFEGLDVRRALPPALDRRRLLDWDALTAWESQALDACARRLSPAEVRSDLHALVTHARRWRAGSGTLAAWIASWTPADRAPADAAPWRPDPRLDAAVRAAVPAHLAAPEAVAFDGPPRWDAGAALVRRYLAARLVACWPLHYGTGLGTVLAYVDALLGVVAGEVARRVPPGREAAYLDVLEAIAEADRLAVHLAAPDALAAALDAAAPAASGGL